jgi:hypothetical protein
MLNFLKSMLGTNAQVTTSADYDEARRLGVSVPEATAVRLRNAMGEAVQPGSSESLDAQLEAAHAKIREVERKREERNRIALDWRTMSADLENLRTRVTRSAQDIAAGRAEIETGLGLLRDHIGGAGFPKEPCPWSISLKIANRRVQIPILEEATVALKATLAAFIEKMRAFGKEHGIDKNLWP